MNDSVKNDDDIDYDTKSRLNKYFNSKFHSNKDPRFKKFNSEKYNASQMKDMYIDFQMDSMVDDITSDKKDQFDCQSIFSNTTNPRLERIKEE